MLFPIISSWVALFLVMPNSIILIDPWWSLTFNSFFSLQSSNFSLTLHARTWWNFSSQNICYLIKLINSRWRKSLQTWIPIFILLKLSMCNFLSSHSHLSRYMRVGSLLRNLAQGNIITQDFKNVYQIMIKTMLNCFWNCFQQASWAKQSESEKVKKILQKQD
jgi:hypothetical protein